MSGIMPRGTRQLLLPASPGFIWGSLVAALVINMALSFWLVKRAAWMPDVLAVVLVFWNVHQPQRIGMGVAFFFGLIMDVHQAALLGQHAMCYAALSFVAIALHRRVLWFKTLTQAFQLLPLFALQHVLELTLRVFFGANWTDWTIVFAPLIEALLWLPATLILFAPQRRSPDPDAHRPL